MPGPAHPTLCVRDAREHNLGGIDLQLPLGCMIVVTGVSGSGKSSLAHDVIYREGQRRYLESLSSYSRQFLGKLGRAAVGQITGLQAAVSVDQRTVISSPRSTVGTMSELHPHLRLLLARAGEPQLSRGEQVESSLLSFNTPRGACPRCSGLGVEDRVDPELLVGDPQMTVREGALVLTTPQRLPSRGQGGEPSPTLHGKIMCQWRSRLQGQKNSHWHPAQERTDEVRMPTLPGPVLHR